MIGMYPSVDHEDEDTLYNDVTTKNAVTQSCQLSCELSVPIGISFAIKFNDAILCSK